MVYFTRYMLFSFLSCFTALCFSQNPLNFGSNIKTADPSAHIFNGRIYVYPSHDYESGVPADGLGSAFAMRDFHVLSMDSIGGKVTDHGVAIDIKDIPWAGRQVWAPDAAFKNDENGDCI